MFRKQKMSQVNENCIFCKIVTKQETKTQVLFENERLVIFRDIKPASDHHYLAIPKVHIPNPKCLTIEDKELGKTCNM